VRAGLVVDGGRLLEVPVTDPEAVVKGGDRAVTLVAPDAGVTYY
jgi:hypothetical protein